VRPRVLRLLLEALEDLLREPELRRPDVEPEKDGRDGQGPRKHGEGKPERDEQQPDDEHAGAVDLAQPRLCADAVAPAALGHLDGTPEGLVAHRVGSSWRRAARDPEGGIPLWIPESAVVTLRWRDRAGARPVKRARGGRGHAGSCPDAVTRRRRRRSHPSSGASLNRLWPATTVRPGGAPARTRPRHRRAAP
jgi:hypothetical protein